MPKPAAVLEDGAGGEEDVGVRVGAAVAGGALVDRHVGHHAPRDELLQDEAGDQREMGVEGEFARQGHFQLARHAAVLAALDGFASVPERFAFGHPSGGLRRREDEARGDARARAVVMGTAMPFVHELVACPVGSGGDRRAFRRGARGRRHAVAARAVIVEAASAFVEELFSGAIRGGGHGGMALAAPDGFPVEVINGHVPSLSGGGVRDIAQAACGGNRFLVAGAAAGPKVHARHCCAMRVHDAPSRACGKPPFRAGQSGSSGVPWHGGNAGM